MKSQKQQILKWLSDGHSLTALMALNKFGCFRLSARIYELVKDGWNIKKEMIYKDGKGYAKYYLPFGKNN
jgi:hypothetical protein